jgi:pimeloyl-ACP methyl ester carboxylesterase
MTIQANIKSGTLISSDKHKIAYDHYTAGHSQVVIIVHGFFNSKQSELLLQLKDGLIDSYDVIMFDFRGHGKSSGLFSWTARENLDLEAVLAYAKTKYDCLGLVAFSFGGSISINVLSKDHSIKSLVAISAPYDAAQIDYHFWDLDIENDILYNISDGNVGKGVRPGAFWLKKQKPADSVKKLTCPVFYIHGDKDWVVRPRHSRRLYELTRSKKELCIIKGGLHAEFLLRKNPKEFIELIRNWFKETLQPGGDK